MAGYHAQPRRLPGAARVAATPAERIRGVTMLIDDIEVDGIRSASSILRTSSPASARST
jgi:hypothetical protein